MARRRARVSFLLALLAVAACRTAGERPLEPVLAPRVATAVRYQLGGPLRGPDAGSTLLQEDAFDAARVLDLKVTIVALAAPLVCEGDALLSEIAPIVSRAKLVLDESPGARPLRATPRALASARAGPVSDPATLRSKLLSGASRGRLLREASACLPPGATAVVEVFRDQAAGAHGRARVALLCARRPDGSGFDLAIEEEEERAKLEPKAAALPTPQDAPRAELLALEPLSSWRTGQASWVTLVPCPFAGEEARELVLIAEASPPPRDGSPGAVAHDECVAQARRDLAAQAAQAARSLAPPAPPTPLPDLAHASAALREPARARRALFTLGLATGAHTAEEVAVSVDDATLAPVASTVAGALEQAPEPRTQETVGLAVEKAVLSACREVLSGDEPPEDLVHALERRGGAALRLLVSLHAELDRAKTLESLEEQIRLENIQLLEDASPLIRVRAARWLGARIDLRDYDPLADAARRREVVKAIQKGRKP